MTVEGVPIERSGFVFVPTDAPVAFTFAWLHSAMPRILRERSIFANYLMPNQKNLKYMADRGYIDVVHKTPKTDDSATSEHVPDEEPHH
jgi:hypothetical protein